MKRCRICAIASKRAIDAGWLVIAGFALLAKLARSGTPPEMALCAGCVRRLRDLLNDNTPRRPSPRRTH